MQHDGREVLGTEPVYVALGSSETLVTPLLKKALESMDNEVVDEQLNDTEVRAPQLKKAPPPILITEAGMVIDVRPELSKALLPMLVS